MPCDLLIYDEEGCALPSSYFADEGADAQGTRTIRYVGPRPVYVSRITHPAGFDLPRLPHIVNNGCRITIPNRPAARVTLTGDVIRNGQTIRDT